MNNSTVWVIETTFGSDGWKLYSVYATEAGAAEETMKYLDIKRRYNPEVDWVGKIIPVNKTQSIHQWDEKFGKVNSIRFYERTLNP